MSRKKDMPAFEEKKMEGRTSDSAQDMSRTIAAEGRGNHAIARQAKRGHRRGSRRK